MLRGAASVLYGGSNPGGLLNYVSKRPGVEVNEVTLGVNEHGTGWTNFDFGRVLPDQSAWRLVGRLQGGDDYGAMAEGWRGMIAPSYRFRTGGGTDVTLLANYTHIDQDQPGAGGFLPYYGTVVATDFGRLDPEANYGEPSQNDYLRKQATLGAQIDHDLGNGWSLSETARIGWSHVAEGSVYPYGYDGFSLTPVDAAGTLSRINFEHDSRTRTVLSDTRLEGAAVTGALRHRLLFGLDAKWFELDQMQASGSATPITVVNPVNGAAQTDPVPYIDQALTQRHLGFYAQDQLSWGDGWIVTGNLRYDVVNTRAGQNAATGAAGSDRSDNELSWRVGLARELQGGFTPYVSAATYFNPQIVTDSGGDAVSPESGRQIEAGVKWAPAERTLVTLAVFDIDRENVSQSVWGGAGYDYYQIGAQNSRGVEIEAKHDFGNGLTAEATFTRTDMEIVNDANAAIIGNAPYNIPETMATLRLDYDFVGDLDGWSVGGGLRHYGKSWADNENTLRVPSATLGDVGVSYGRDAWRANLAVSNVTDERYVASCQTAFVCGYGAGREISLTLTQNW